MTRKSFLAISKAFNSKYKFAWSEESAFLGTLEPMMNTQYCEAVISENFDGARAVAAYGRTTLTLLLPFTQDLSLEFAELERLTNFLESAISRAAIDAKDRA
jgi:hypothetical protein